MQNLIWVFSICFLGFISIISAQPDNARPMNISSPDGKIQIRFNLDNGIPHFSVYHENQPVIQPSPMGFRFKGEPPLNRNFVVTDTVTTTFDEIWQPVWGTRNKVHNHYNELTVQLKEQDSLARELAIVFRAFDDGVAFRYIFPEQPNLGQFEMTGEDTYFRLAGDHSAWWIPNDYDSYEHLYRNTPVSEISGVNTPITMETADGLYLSIHEADLIDYSEMTLEKVEEEPTTLKSVLVPWPQDSVRVKAATPHQSPWRTIQIATRPGALIESYLIQNLNPPNKLDDFAWIQPMKYVGIWWSLHIGKETWHQGPNHGATTENAKRYIDFASKHGIGGLLVEGWNVGWENWGKGNNFDFLQAYPDYDLEEVVHYGKEKGVEIIAHNETGSNVTNYLNQIDSAFAYYERLGIHGIKTGYVGPITPDSVHHHGQWMVNHYREVVQKAAKHKIMVDVHEPIKPTGEERTYPNMMTREGVRGMEYNAWSDGNPPSHTTIVPFTRMLAGPLDYTPGIFDLTFDEYKEKERVHTTLAKQLALYVVLFSPLQMAADLPENYEGYPMFTFIEHVPVTWDDTRVLNGKIGDFVTIARKHGDSWYIGSLTDENARTFKFPLNFLDANKKYVAHIYADGDDAHWESNPYSYQINHFLVDNSVTLNIALAPGGGQAVEIVPAWAEDFEKYREYPQN